MGRCNIARGIRVVEELILIKYFRNAFLATKVAFFNEMYDLCQATDLDYKTVSWLVGQDPRIGNSHTEVTEQRLTIVYLPMKPQIAIRTKRSWTL